MRGSAFRNKVIGMNIVKGFIDFLFPHYCFNCGAESDGPLCEQCLAQVKQISEFCPKCGKPLDSDVKPLCTREICAMDRLIGYDFEYARAAVYYNAPAKKLLHEFKYRYRKHIISPLYNAIEETVERILIDDRIDLIVPVPLFYLKRWKRGFNQARIIAKHISDSFNIPLFSALKRVKSTKMQAYLDFDARFKNVRDAFKLKKKIDFYQKNVLLVDDIITTGNTLNECARILKKYNAGKIIAFAVARN